MVNFWLILDVAHKESTDFFLKLSVQNFFSITFKEKSEIWSYGNNKEFHAFSHGTVVDMRENFDVSSEYLNNL